MSKGIEHSTLGDAEAILALYPLAFPDEDLTALVTKLVGRDDIVSLVVKKDKSIIGHAVFSLGSNEQGAQLALLGPIAVHPTHQRDGLGKALIAEGARHLAATGVGELLVLGDPEYYRHRGFDAPADIEAPYPLKPEWRDAWRSMLLDGQTRATGTLSLPEPWMSAEYWR